MLRFSSAKVLFRHIFLWLGAFVFCTPAMAQTQEIQPLQPNTDIRDVITRLPQTLQIQPVDPKGRILTKVAQGPINWQAAYDQVTADLRPFRPGAGQSGIPTTSTAVIRQFRADERTLRNMVAEVKRLNRTMGSIDRPTLPVLLPPDPPMLDIYKKMASDFPDARALDGKMAFFHGLDDHYASTFEMNGLDIMINGSRIEFSSDARKLRQDRAEEMSDGTLMLPIERDDVGVSLRFNRFGAAYIIEVACANPRTDSRCRQDGFITDVYKKLLLFGGRP